MPQRLSDVPLVELVPETRHWNEGNGIDLRSWIGCVGNIEHAIGYAELFWPDFILFDDCVFFAGKFSEEGYFGFLKHSGGNKQATEGVMNHWHILDLFFSDSTVPPMKEQVIYLGRLLKDIWEVKLRHDFPERLFVVSFPEGPTDDLSDYEVTFYQKRN